MIQKKPRQIIVWRHRCIIDCAAREDLSEIAKHTHDLPVCHKKPFLFRICAFSIFFFFYPILFYLFNTLLAKRRFFNGHPMTRRFSPFILSYILFLYSYFACLLIRERRTSSSSALTKINENTAYLRRKKKKGGYVRGNHVRLRRRIPMNARKPNLIE